MSNTPDKITAIDKQTVKDTLTKQAASFELPPSNLLSDNTHYHLVRSQQQAAEPSEALKAFMAAFAEPVETAPIAHVPEIRERQAKAYYNMPTYTNMTQRYDVNVQVDSIAGVAVEIFTPATGVCPENRSRVLINCHGGGFINGARMMSHKESIPIAAIGNIKVISVDYRMAPEHTFPAATDDVLAVYRELLNSYQPQNIGIYGSSAGALLVAQTLARLQSDNLPPPAAIAMGFASAFSWEKGDSFHLARGLSPSFPVDGFDINNPYFAGRANNDPEVYPGNDLVVLKRFPPSLLLSATRDNGLSSVVHNHSQLVKLGVETQLHVWEGLGHVFHYDSELPESREVYDVVVRFFEKYMRARG